MLAEALAALLGTVAGVQHVRRPRPGTPEDLERRIRRLEKRDDEREERLGALEGRMSTQENTVAGALGRLTESNDRLWQALERNTDKVDALTAKVIEVDVETKVERSERHHRRGRDTDPTQE
jgi:uncharacterized coiled-coil protein SlyX